MCVTQFRDYVDCSYFKSDTSGSYSKDFDDKSLAIRLNTYTRHKNSSGDIYDSSYYVTDIGKVKKLAKLGNKYAINYLENQELLESK